VTSPLEPLDGRTLADLAATIEPASVTLSEKASRHLLSYLSLLLRWNRVHNLTNIQDPTQGMIRHLLDCLSILPTLDAFQAERSDRPLRILDAGSGAGLPGIPLAICRPDWSITLVDAVQKKTSFQRQAALELNLPNIEAQHARLETLRIAPVDAVVSRAFASLADFVRLTQHSLLSDGRWFAMKGKVPHAELEALPPKTVVRDTITLRVPTLDEARHLIVLCPEVDRT
jgi:16S rRNA (guanine527-N7)-methyltransferase